MAGIRAAVLVPRTPGPIEINHPILSPGSEVGGGKEGERVVSGKLQVVEWGRATRQRKRGCRLRGHTLTSTLSSRSLKLYKHRYLLTPIITDKRAKTLIDSIQPTS